MKSYLGVTAHYISKDGKLEEDLVGFLRMRGSHTGQAMAKRIFDDVLRWYNLVKPV
jgi:hypothetical protein